MPKNIVQLLRDLTKAGYKNRGGKGSHRNYEHACGHRVTMAIHGKGEAKHYQQRDVEEAVRIAREWKNRGQS